VLVLVLVIVVVTFPTARCSIWYILVAAETGLVCHANWYQKLVPVGWYQKLVPETGQCVMGFSFRSFFLRDCELSSPRVGVSASCPVTVQSTFR